MRPTENIGQWVVGSIAMWFLTWFALAICRGIKRLFTREVVMPDPWENAVRIVTQPQRMPDGRWMSAELTWKPCDAPIAPNTLDVHDRNAPGHDAKTCPHCKPAKGYSGVSYRPTN
jgi:hypothetical protein